MYWDKTVIGMDFCPNKSNNFAIKEILSTAVIIQKWNGGRKASSLEKLMSQY